MTRLRTNFRWSRENLAWVAGIVEGEGCIRLGDNNGGTTKALTLHVNMTDPDIVRRLQTITGCGRFYGPYDHGSGKQMYSWKSTRSQETYAVLMALLPWLGERRTARVQECVRGWWEYEESQRLKRGSCSRGHPWTVKTTYLHRKTGQRHCRACVQINKGRKVTVL
jgi:hypothetical protein